MNVLDSTMRGLGIARVSSHEDMAAFGGRNGEPVFLVQPCKLALLLPPLGTSLALGAHVGLWEQLLDSHDGDRMCWGNKVVDSTTASGLFSSATFLVFAL